MLNASGWLHLLQLLLACMVPAAMIAEIVANVELLLCQDQTMTVFHASLMRATQAGSYLVLGSNAM